MLAAVAGMAGRGAGGSVVGGGEAREVAESGGQRCGKCGHVKKWWPDVHSDGKMGREACSVSMVGVELPKLSRGIKAKGKCVHPGCTQCPFHV